MHDVTPDEAAAPALKKARRVVETEDGKEQGLVELHACQEGENDYAEVVVVYEPEGTSLMMGGLHPRVRALPTIQAMGYAVPVLRTMVLWLPVIARC